MILLLVLLFALMMGFFEASVVIYLRELYYPLGFSFPMQDIPDHVLLVELGREMASLLMIYAVAWASGRKLPLRIAFFLMIFGVWDIVYYLVLKLFLNWPLTVMDWDILFLIPVPWIAPVLAPVIAAVSMFLMGTIIYHLDNHGYIVNITPRDLIAAAVCSTPILVSFFHNTQTVLDGHFPETYPWLLFLSGILAAWIYFILRIRHWKLTGSQARYPESPLSA